MAVVQLSDIIQPEFFAEYMANNSMVSTALFHSGVLVPNARPLHAGDRGESTLRRIPSGSAVHRSSREGWTFGA